MSSPKATPQKPGSLHVLIIGAGVTGLLIAHGLKKAGIKFTIFESEVSSDHHRPREWSMGIHWSLPALEGLLPDHLAARLKEAQNDPYFEHKDNDVLPIYNGKTGDVMKELPIGRTIRVSRRKMRTFCSQDITIQYDHELSSVAYGDDGQRVEAIFTNGKRVPGDIISGSDGPRSKVRELLLGVEKAATSPLGVVHVNVAVQYADAEKARFIREAHPIFSLMIHPSGTLSFVSIQDVPDPDKPETWRFQVVMGWIGQLDASLDNAGRVAQVKARAAELAEPFRSAYLWIPDDTQMTSNNIGYWVSIPWDNRGGRATLAGDAAHPMPPHRGQGLNHAICDAANLVSAIKKANSGEAYLADTIQAYEDEMIPRGADEVNGSKQNALMVMDWDRLMQSPMMTRGLKKGSD
ncbi:MAG: hypothetical protein M1825_005465 [Sarcosagium campestre]|nr:MAG: hypothetical protein M1825_005465 [Sarcosagium campestre]